MILSPRYLVEPVMLLFMFTYIMQLIYYSGIYQADVWYDQTKNETLVRYCLYHKTEEICKNLSENGTKAFSTFNMYISIESSLVGIVVNFLVGYLADRVSRTSILRVSIFTSILSSTVLLVNSFILQMPLYVYYIAIFISYLGGGFGAFMGTAMAFISDVADKNSRTSRIAVADGMLQLGALFGTFVGGQLMSHAVWYSTPLLCLVINLSLGFYVLVVIKNPQRVKKQKSESLKEAFSQMIDVYTGPTKYRARIIILSAAYLLHFTAFLSYAGFFVNYLLMPPFNWPADRIGLLSSISSIANFLLVMMVPLMKMAKIPETLIAAISCAMCCLGFGVVTVARSFALITVANLLKGGSGVALALYRSRLSKVVKPNQYGQLFMLLGSFESLATLISSVGLYQVYLLTRKWYPGFAFTILVVLEALALILTLWDGYIARRQGDPDHTELLSNEQTDEQSDDQLLDANDFTPRRELTVESESQYVVN